MHSLALAFVTGILVDKYETVSLSSTEAARVDFEDNNCPKETSPIRSTQVQQGKVK